MRPARSRTETPSSRRHRRLQPKSAFSRFVPVFIGSILKVAFGSPNRSGEHLLTGHSGGYTRLPTGFLHSLPRNAPQRPKGSFLPFAAADTPLAEAEKRPSWARCAGPPGPSVSDRPPPIS
jgi:hypothetical protein